MKNFKIGSAVKLKKKFRGRDKGWARIETFYSDIPGGVRLDAPLNRFYSWNVADLLLVKEKQI